ncbi:MAG TPA: hypothetical protein VGZ22_06600, partial [Isosphaeraceae bacterium]|nr:hypothetical protein [Isosphaeraceae bacterium]
NDDVGNYGVLERPLRWSSKRVNTYYTERFLALAADHGIAVFWVMPIVSPSLQERREQMGLDAQYASFVSDMQAKHPNLTVIDGRRSSFERSVFIDPVHLDQRGASILSAKLAAVVRDRRPGFVRDPSWVELPSFRNLLAEQGAEDLPSSQAALHLDGGTRR